jgi:hypothetical protein
VFGKSSKTDKVTTFELSGCLDGRALQGFFPQDIAGSNLLTWIVGNQNAFVSIIGDG